MSRLALFLTHSPPRPSVSGDRIRTFNLMRQLRERGWRTSLFSLVPPDEPPNLETTLAEAADDWELVPRGVGTLRRALRLAIGLAARTPFQQQWFWSASAARTCAAWLDRAPAAPILVEQLYMYPFVPVQRRSSVVLDAQNVEEARIAGMAHADANALRRVLASLQVAPVAAYERTAVASVGRVLAVSREEQDVFEVLAPGRVDLVPNGVDVASIQPRSAVAPSSRRMLYLGSMSYGPNVDAITYFVDEIAPHVRADDLSLDIVGSRPAGSVHRAAARSPIPAHVSGFVTDVAAAYRASRAMVVPLRHGGGTRLKILEALAYGLPVVTTSAGCAGLGLVDEEVALVADSPAEFADAVDRVMEDDHLWTRLSAAGRTFVEERFDWRVIGQQLNRSMLAVDRAA